MAKRGQSGFSFILGVYKPSGMSSHDVINVCRRAFGERRVGHAGTLDPLASGVLPVCVGPATRLCDYLSGQDKEYCFTVCFGARTTTDDQAGEITETGPVPDELLDPFFVQDFIASLVGSHDQVPPQYSAIKVEGTRAYAHARKGERVSLASRTIHIYEAELLGIHSPSNQEEYASWTIRVVVSKGTYIRSLARDIGVAVDCPAHVGQLERTRVGSLSKEDCVECEEIESVQSVQKLDPVMLLGRPRIDIDDNQAQVVTNGAPLSFVPDWFSDSSISKGDVVCVCYDGALKALYRFEGVDEPLKAQVVFPIGVECG